MREKILAQLKAYLKTLGVANLSTARLNAIADKLAPKITDEKDIDAKLEELNDLMPFADTAKQDDRLRTLEAKSKKPETKPAADPDDDDEPVDPDKPKPRKEKVPEWAKALVDEVKSLKAEKAQTSIRQKIAEKLKDIPEIIWDGRALPEKEEDIDNWTAEVTTKWTAFKQDKKNEGLLGTPKPGGAGTGEVIATGKEEADIEKWAAAESKKEEIIKK